MGVTDRELLELWQSGNAEGFEALVRRWEQPIGRLLVRLVGSRELAQDLCQEVFLRAYRAGPTFRGEAAFSTWLYRIALNAARDAGRRRSLRPVALPSEGLVAADDPVEAVCEQAELSAVLAQALAQLPEPLREIIVLRHYEGLSFEAIARMTGTAASTLKSRFAVALTRLRAQLLPYVKEEASS